MRGAISKSQNVKDHAAEVARIKAAKEQAEAERNRVKEEMHEELERARTQYIFKVTVLALLGANRGVYHYFLNDSNTSSRRVAARRRGPYGRSAWRARSHPYRRHRSGQRAGI